MNKTYIVAGIIVIVAIIGVIFLGNNTKAPKNQKESLTIKGSDTEVQLVSALAEAFSKENPGIDISVTGGGSGVGIASLINKEIDVANSSRKIEDSEISKAKENNIDVQQFILAIDGLSIIANPNNKIEKLSVDQISKIYKGEIKNWKDVGGTDKKIVLYGRQSTSGTYTFFRNFVVKDDYSPEMKNMEGSQAIVDAVKSDESAIGYVGVGYVKDDQGNVRNDIKILPVIGANDNAISPLDKEAVQRGEYPIMRQIFQYLAYLPNKDSIMDKFIRFETSEAGQKIIEKSGFYTLTNSDIQQNESLFEKIK